MVEQQSSPFRSSNHTTGSSIRIAIAIWSTGTGCAADSSWSRPCSILCSCRRKSQPNSHVTWPFDICFCMVRWYKHSTARTIWLQCVHNMVDVRTKGVGRNGNVCVCVFFPCLFFFFRFPSIFIRVTRGIFFFFFFYFVSVLVSVSWLGTANVKSRKRFLCTWLLPSSKIDSFSFSSLIGRYGV